MSHVMKELIRLKLLKRFDLKASVFSVNQLQIQLAKFWNNQIKMPITSKLLYLLCKCQDVSNKTSVRTFRVAGVNSEGTKSE